MKVTGVTTYIFIGNKEFEKILCDFQGTVLAVSHDRWFIQRFANKMWTLENGHLHVTTTLRVALRGS